jgi:predicted Zn-dependent peptidase
MTPEAFGRRLRRGGIEFTSAVDADRHAIYVRAVKSGFGEALDLLRSILERPALRPQALQRLVSARLPGLDRNRFDPVSAARVLRSAAAFGPRDRRARLSSVQALRSMTREGCRRFLSKHLNPHRAQLVAVGDTTMSTLLDEFRSRLGSWRAKTDLPTQPSVAKAPRPALLHLVDLPGVKAPVVMALYQSSPFGARWNAASSLVGLVLQGILRQHLEPVAYAVHSDLQEGRTAQLRSFWVQTEEASVGRTLGHMAQSFAEIRGMPRTTFVAQASKEAALFDVVAGLDSGAGLLEFFSKPVNLGLSTSHAGLFLTRLAALQASELDPALREIDVDRIHYLVAGDKRILLAQLAGFFQGSAGVPGGVEILAATGDVMEMLSFSGGGLPSPVLGP